MSVNNDMERIGRLVATDQDLDVSCRGMMAYATPGAIVIPSLENLDHLGPDAERMMHGYLDHECAHASDTDFDLYRQAVDDVGLSFKHLLNAVEDGYIEGRQGHRYIGSRYNLGQKNTWFWSRKDEDGEVVADKIKDPDIDPWRKFTLAVTLCVRPWGGRVAEDFRHLDADTFARLQLVADDIAEVGTLLKTPNATQACYDIAKRIWDRFTLGSGSGKADPELQLDLEAWDAEAEAVRKLLQDPESAINQALAQVLGGEDFGAEGADDGDGGQIELPDEDDPGADTPSVRGERPYIVFSHEYDHEIDFVGDVAVSDKYDNLVHETAVSSDALVHAFEAALRARTETSATYGHDEGIIDPLTLAEFSVGARGSDTLYTQFTGEEDADDVAVAVLVDCSGSMGNYKREGSKARLAAQAATAIHRACAACHLVHEVTGFTTTYPNGAWRDASKAAQWVIPEDRVELARVHLREAQSKGQNPLQFARIVADWGSTRSIEGALCFPAHAVFKSFASSDARGISHIDGVGANLDGEAVMWQARRLAARPEKRRVMFVLSDGFPTGATEEADEHGYLKEAVNRVTRAGIEVYGIGIQSSAVAEFYPQHWVAHSLEDLTEIAMGALIDVLSGNRQEMACVTL